MKTTFVASVTTLFAASAIAAPLGSNSKLVARTEVSVGFYADDGSSYTKRFPTDSGIISGGSNIGEFLRLQLIVWTSCILTII